MDVDPSLWLCLVSDVACLNDLGRIRYHSLHALMTWAALDIIPVYTVPIVLLGLVAIFIIVTLKLRRVGDA